MQIVSISEKLGEDETYVIAVFLFLSISTINEINQPIHILIQWPKKSPTITCSRFRLIYYQPLFLLFQITKSIANMGASQSQPTHTEESQQPSVSEKQLSHSFTALNLDDDQARVRFAGLSHESLERYEEEFYADPKNQFALNAITRNEITSVLINHKAAVKDQHIFNVQTDVEGKVTNQKSSGRCWLFAGE